MPDSGLTTRSNPTEQGGERDTAPVVWSMEARHAIRLSESLVVAESLHVAILSLAGRRFGARAIPSALSGRGVDGRPLSGSDQHRHKHVLVGSEDSDAISHLAIWAPGGLTREEREVVTGARLRWAKQFLALTPDPGGAHPAFAAARSWRSLTPYLPFNHVKPRGRNSVEGQVRRELVEFRELREPATVTARPWTGGLFQLRRSDGRQVAPAPSPLEVRITFEEPVVGPVVLGRHAHFSLGLMRPDDASADD